MPETEKILTPEMPAQPSPESGVEIPHRPEQPAPAIESQEKGDTGGVRPIAAPDYEPPTHAPSPEAQQIADIERILEEDLGEMYFKLPEDKRAAFKIKGEVTAKEINALLVSAKATAKKVVSLIRAWLLLIPGINTFFLEQEAKIKADKVMKLNGRL